MSKKIGKFLQTISLYWMAFALLRTLAGLVGIGSNKDVIRGLIGIAIAVTLYFLGKWLQTFSIAESLEKTKTVWWRADYKFRLVVFLNGAWILGALFFQEGYYYDWDFILYPPSILLVLYFGYTKLVVGDSFVDSNIIENSKIQEVDAQKNDFAQSSPLNIELPQNGKDRERAMDELIRRMETKTSIK